MTVNQYSIAASRSKRSYTIRGLNASKEPRKACPTCYADCVSLDAGTLIEYRCPRGHQFTGNRDDGLNHAKFLAHYFAGQDGHHR